MGLLDEAIREHLDLKRRRGADPAEIERAEREALGPVRREPAVALPLAAQEALGGYELDEPSRSSIAAEPRPHKRRGLFSRRHHEEPGDLESIDSGSGSHYDDEGFDEAVEQALRAPADEPEARRFLPDDELEMPPTSIYERPPEDVYEADPAHRDGPADEPHGDDHPATSDDHPAASPPQPVSAAPRSTAPPSGGGLGDTAEFDVEGSIDGPPEAGDVLEETPEFLQDTPDHDRLWFEQKPPRDFDFDA